MPLISQKKAIQTIKAETGLSFAACAQIVAKLPKKADGARQKINTYQLNRAITETNRPIEMPQKSGVVLSPKMIERIRKYCV